MAIVEQGPTCPAPRALPRSDADEHLPGQLEAAGALEPPQHPPDLRPGRLALCVGGADEQLGDRHDGLLDEPQALGGRGQAQHERHRVRPDVAEARPPVGGLEHARPAQAQDREPGERPPAHARVTPGDRRQEGEDRVRLGAGVDDRGEPPAPGTRTSRIPRKARPKCGKNISPRRETAASNDPASMSIRSASICRTARFVAPAARAASAAACTIAGAMSVARTQPAGPTRRAAASASGPAPAARTRTRLAAPAPARSSISSVA